MFFYTFLIFFPKTAKFAPKAHFWMPSASAQWGVVAVVDVFWGERFAKMTVFYQKLEQLCADAKTSVKRVVIDVLGLSQGMGTAWKAERSEPSAADVAHIASFFEIGIKYLLDNSMPVEVGLGVAAFGKKMEVAQTNKSNKKEGGVYNEYLGRTPEYFGHTPENFHGAPTDIDSNNEEPDASDPSAPSSPSSAKEAKKKMAQELYSRIEVECKKRGITSMSRLAKNCGLSSSGVYKWQKDTMPLSDNLLAIAKYFETTMEYLLTGRSPRVKGVGDVAELKSKIEELRQDKKRLERDNDNLWDTVKDLRESNKSQSDSVNKAIDGVNAAVKSGADNLERLIKAQHIEQTSFIDKLVSGIPQKTLELMGAK
ncbi:MAG: helix-turn-helix domain-containing protein [Chitinispirillales bacterium]|jgi:transcriptional regulator with XRE-family HTH domain|nr:helix-turn-helix domain-containing protein [Chitinispirillales bacterium]